MSVYMKISFGFSVLPTFFLLPINPCVFLEHNVFRNDSFHGQCHWMWLLSDNFGALLPRIIRHHHLEQVSTVLQEVPIFILGVTSSAMSAESASQCDFVHNGRMTIYAKQTWGKNKNLTKVNFCWRQKLWPILNHLCPFWTQKKGVGKNKDIWYIMYHKQLLSQQISRAWKNSSIHDSVTFSKSGPSTAVTTEAGRSKPLHMQICGIERQPSCRCWIEAAY